MPDWIVVTLSALLGGVIGGGAFAGLFYRALKDKLIGDLKTIFAKRSELNAYGGRLETMEKTHMGINDAVAHHQDRLQTLDAKVAEINRHGSEPLRAWRDEQRDALEAIRLSIAELRTELRPIIRNGGK